jgi:adenosylmethionine---8-amino-7-oxononanoate aminotransferase
VPMFNEASHLPPMYCYRCHFRQTYPSCDTYCADYLERLLRLQGPENVAAFIAEPVVGATLGAVPPVAEYFPKIREICDRNDILFIADEVMTGFGRTGRMFACELEEVTPDFMAVSKGLTGGYLPLAATLTTERVYAGFLGDFKDRRTFYHGHTYTGNPLACAAALAAIGIFERDRVLEKTRKKIHLMGNLLQDFYAIDEVGDIRTCGLIAGMELVKNPATKEPFPADLRMGHRVTLEARRRGVIVRPLGDILVLMPPLSIAEAELETLVSAYVAATKAALIS